MTSRSDRPTGPSRVITSVSNDTVKFIRSLEMRKVRRDTGLFVAEGASVLITARENGWVPRTLVHGALTDASAPQRDLVRWAQQQGTECLEVSQAVLEKLASKDNPQSVMGVLEQRWHPLPTGKAMPREGVWLALEEIRDPGNLGTILRTVDAVGARGVILVGTCCDPYAREAVRATMGSIFAVPLIRCERQAFIDWVGGWPGDVVGTHLAAREDFRAAPYTRPTLVVMGSEGPGMSAPVAAACNRLIRIPMTGKLDSLNLAVATALILYEIRRADLGV